MAGGVYIHPLFLCPSRTMERGQWRGRLGALSWFLALGAGRLFGLAVAGLPFGRRRLWRGWLLGDTARRRACPRVRVVVRPVPRCSGLARLGCRWLQRTRPLFGSSPKPRLSLRAVVPGRPPPRPRVQSLGARIAQEPTKSRQSRLRPFSSPAQARALRPEPSA